MPTLVDSNVILDVVTQDHQWAEWSESALEQATESDRLIINPLIYAEVSVRFSRIDELDEAVPEDQFIREPLPWSAGFLAGKVFRVYRQRHGTRSHPLPDFYIGAHAAVRGYTLLTRDPRRFRTYFPQLRLITP